MVSEFVIDLTAGGDNSFENKIINVKGCIVVDFWASWCGPCKMFGPSFEAVAEKMHDRVSFFKCNIDNCPNIASVNGVSAVPTIILFKDGKPIKKSSGASSVSVLETWINEALE